MKINQVVNTILAAFEHTIDVEPRDYDAKTKTFSFEMSSKDIKSVSKIVKLRNPKTNGILEFVPSKIDYDQTHEDILGYWYSNKDGYKLLIIND
jgi:hypothetical protein